LLFIFLGQPAIIRAIHINTATTNILKMKNDEKILEAIKLSNTLRDFLLKEIKEYIDSFGEGFGAGQHTVHLIYDPDENRDALVRTGESQWKPPETHCSNQKFLVTCLMNDHVVCYNLSYQRKDYLHKEGFIIRTPSHKISYYSLPVSILMNIFLSFYGTSNFGR
jgi:hypothetical protein